MAGARGDHERRLAGEQRGVRIGAGRQQPPDHRLAAVLAGGPERRHAEIVRGVDVGAGANQQVRGFQIVAIRGPVEGRGAVAVRRIDDGAGRLRQQRAQDGLVAGLHGVDERRRGASRGEQQQR